MSPENVTAHPLQLRYTLTSDDLLDGFTAQHRGIQGPWYLRWPGALVMVGVIAVIVLSSTVPGTDTVGTAVITAALVLVVLVPIAVGLGLLLSRVVLRGSSNWILRSQIRHMIRANPALTQPMQATVTDNGMHLSSVAGQATSWGWVQYPLHIETDRSFVLLASERRGGAVLVLPKRGLDAPDPTPLRSLLAAHSHRLS